MSHLIPLQRILQHLANAMGEPLRMGHLELATTAEDVATEVGRRVHVEFELGVFVALVDFALAMVDGEVAQVVALVAKGADNDTLRLGVVSNHGTVVIFEEALGIEVDRHFEPLVRKRQMLDAVEGVDAVSQGRIIVHRQMTQHIPTALEELDAIGFEDDLLALRMAILLILHLKADILLHGLEDGLQTGVFRRDGLQKDALLQGDTFADGVADGEGREHPSLHRILGKDTFVANEVSVAIATVAIDVDAEDVLDSIYMTIEGGAGKRESFAHIGLQPLGLQVGKGDSSGLTDGVYQPDVFSEFSRCLHGDNVNSFANVQNISRIRGIIAG